MSKTEDHKDLPAWPEEVFNTSKISKGVFTAEVLWIDAMVDSKKIVEEKYAVKLARAIIVFFG